MGACLGAEDLSEMQQFNLKLEYLVTMFLSSNILTVFDTRTFPTEP